jgi:hypothetical protein
MEPASLALGIAALYTTCRDCYDFFTTMGKAETESSIHLRELQIQRSTHKAWGFHWQIHEESGGQLHHQPPDRKRLQAYLLSNRFKAEGVFDTLSALADTLSNQEKLIKRYGIQLRPAQSSPDASMSTNNVTLAIHNTKIEDVEPVVSEVKHRLSMLHKFKWAMKDKDCFKQLITDLKSHNESLYRLCPENAFDSMNIYLTMECLARLESTIDLKSTSRIATEQAADDGTSLLQAGYRLLASTATLKASVNENRDGGPAKGNTLTPVDEVQREMRYLGQGLALFEGQVVYVEMRDYRGATLERTPEQKKRIKRRQNRDRVRDQKDRRSLSRANLDEFDGENDVSVESDESDDCDEPIEVVRPADPELRALIVNFFKTFQGARIRHDVFGLDVVGMIDHTKGEYKGHCSILYRLPGTMGIRTRERPADDLSLRAPVTLQSLLDKTHKGMYSPLGARFELARKLVRAVCLLHTSGWLHKNIRAKSVLFFPEHATRAFQEDSDRGTKIDVSKPILMGYIFSRPDDIVRKFPPSAQQTGNTRDDGSADEQVDADLDERTQYPSLYTPKRRPRYSDIYGHNTLETIGEPQETQQTNISGFKLDYYQHPAKHADPQRMYRHAYDVYSLGILLLEVGLWKKLRVPEEPDAETQEDHYELRRWIRRKYLDTLRWTCGDTYADVVLSCILIDCSDDEAGLASERELCAKLVADLEGCRA